MRLIIGVLFVSISATVAAASLSHLVLPTLGLVAVLVLITRPLVALLATLRTNLTSGEREFTGWMARAASSRRPPRRRLSAQLAAKHVGGASTILPVTFLAIVATVALCGLSAVPVARRSVAQVHTGDRLAARQPSSNGGRRGLRLPAGRRDWRSHPMLAIRN